MCGFPPCNVFTQKDSCSSYDPCSFPVGNSVISAQASLGGQTAFPAKEEPHHLGTPGTGKTWLGKAIATKACQEGHRTRWVTYPFLCRELMCLKAEDSKKLEARIKYYCGFDLLCVDEFPNYDIEDKYYLVFAEQ